MDITIHKPYHILTPVVYRYMPQEFVTEFFKTGKLRLSSFASYHKYEDQEKGDQGEGKSIAVAKDPKRGRTSIAVVASGDNVYSLSTSTILSDEMKTKFESDGVFRITNAERFGIEIALALPGYLNGSQGHCQYQEKRTTTVEDADLDIEAMKISPDSNNLDMGKMHKAMAKQIPLNTYYLKPLRQQDQSEYRFIWFVDNKNDDYIEIECPRALQYCQLVTE